MVEIASASDSQTAKDFIDAQLDLEADAREALPYAFDKCSGPLGPLRQNAYACLTCNPPPANDQESKTAASSSIATFTPAAVCYSCSISCHGEHELVELFSRRNFVCDCGTTRISSSTPCTLRVNLSTGIVGDVRGEEPGKGNKYNQNVRNRFCACSDWYVADNEKGTMFQCLGLADEADGGCGEDWWHPECIAWGPEEGRRRRNRVPSNEQNKQEEMSLRDVDPSFPQEDEFETFVCYKCVNAAPWIKQYAGTKGFLPAVYRKDLQGQKDQDDDAHEQPHEDSQIDDTKTLPSEAQAGQGQGNFDQSNLKRKIAEEESNEQEESEKRIKLESRADHEQPVIKSQAQPQLHTKLPSASDKVLSLFCKEDFRDHFCRCPECYPRLSQYRQLLESEDVYEPPVSESAISEAGGAGSTLGSKSLLERGEEALSNVDRVRAIEGVMVYNHLKDKVKTFLQPFAASGQAVGAEDIKAYFEKLRGDDDAIRQAGTLAVNGEDGDDGGNDNRKEQKGF